MDTRLCDAAFELADGADMLVCESTFCDADSALASEYGHLTAGQAGRIAAEAGARLLVLTHFSQRYGPAEMPQFAAEAGAAFGGEIVVANDLDRIPVPRRPRLTAPRASPTRPRRATAVGRPGRASSQTSPSAARGGKRLGFGLLWQP